MNKTPSKTPSKNRLNLCSNNREKKFVTKIAALKDKNLITLEAKLKKEKSTEFPLKHNWWQTELLPTY